jgi:AcrR family transcriptional regulator
MADDAGAPGVDEFAEGLRERKKRMTRQLLSDTATLMFLERGFDGFKITEVAEECGVSEKTVYNYFPTKESLILDQEDAMAEAIRTALGPDNSASSPVDAMLAVLSEQRRHLREGLADIGGDEAGLAMFRRFMTAIDATPSLRAARGEMTDRIARIAAVALAERAGVSPDDPEPTVAAQALIGLSQVQSQALRRDASPDETATDVYARAEDELRRAARLIDTGLWSFAMTTASGSGSKEQLKAAAESAQAAGRQVAAALKSARKMFSEMQAAHAAAPGGGSGPWSADWSPFDDGDPRSREARQQWRETQREQVQRWRESQREQAQQLRESARAFQQETKEAQRLMKEELKAAHRAHQAQMRNCEP